MKLPIKKTTTCAVFLVSGAASAWAQGDAQDLYLHKCATCHGPDGTAKTALGRKLKVKDAHGPVAKMSVDAMIKIVANGGHDMDGYGKQLNKDQIKGLVDYYRGLAK